MDRDSHRDLVRLATRAASSRNTQPWKFRGEPSAISILPDFSRRCPTLDPDDHHLFVSLGCAAENLTIAASAAGFTPEVSFDAARDGGCIDVRLESGHAVATPLHAAIERRQCTRALYDGRAVSPADLRQLEEAATGSTCSIILLTEPREVETVAEYVAQANTAQNADPKFITELVSMMRFNRPEAELTGDGLYTAALGDPEMPRWVGKLVTRSNYAARKRNDTDMKQIRSSAGVAVFVGDRYNRAHWVEVGRRYERFALQATALGLRNAFINQPAEAAVVRAQFASWLGLHRRTPDLVVRFGYGPEMPRALRRPLDQVLLD